jgi:solute carrier family 29 (equilibrative nucleoside transporter), member 1/2/3
MTIQNIEETFVTNINTYNTVADSKFVKSFKIVTFHLAGVSCLIAYNALLSGLDCFIVYFENYYPQLVFPNLYFLFNFGFQIFFMLQSIKYSHFILIQTCLVITIATLIFNPIIIKILPTLSSFIITCIFTALQGFSNAMLFNLFYSLIMHLDNEYITATIAGHSLSGIIMNLTRLSTFFIYGLEKKENNNSENLDKSFFAFYYTASLILLINFIMMIFLRKQKDFKLALRKASPSDELFDEEINNDERCLSLCSDPYKNSPIGNSIAIPNPFKLTEYEKVEIICKKLTSIIIIMFVHTIITFSIYPGVLLVHQIYSENKGYSIILSLIIFNLSDMISREMTRFFYFESVRSIIIVVLLRLLLFILFPIVCIYLSQTEFSKFFLNRWMFSCLIVLLSATGGFIISNCFIYIHNTEKIQDGLKSKASLVLSAFLNFGCFVGGLLSYIFVWGR